MRALALVVSTCLFLAADASSAFASSPSSSVVESASLRVAAAHVEGSRVGDELVWRARFVLLPDEPESGALRFAAPLPEGTTLEPADGLVAMRDEGRIVGLRAAGSARDGRSVSAVFLQPLPRAADARLAVPIVAGTSVHVVETTDVVLAPTPSLRKHLGYTATAGASPGAIAEARRLTGGPLHRGPRFRTAYVRGDDVSSGLVGTVDRAEERARTTGGVIAAAFALAVAALVLGWRRLRHAASVERADAVLAAEIDRVEDACGR